jgi:hAT family C-terminal dimerisation region
MNYAIPQYLQLLNKLELLRTAFGSNTTLGKACTSAYDKLYEYYRIIRKQNYGAISTICDPRFNINVFSNLWPGDSGSTNRNRVRIQFIEVFTEYERRERAIQAERIAIQNESNTRHTIASNIDPDSESDLFTPQNTIDYDAEYTKWMKQPPVKRETDILRYWASKEYEFPTIARIARDHLAIPATSAPSECVFSSGSDIVTKKRNRLGGDSIRRLLCLRDWGVLEKAEETSDIEEEELNN